MTKPFPAKPQSSPTAQQSSGQNRQPHLRVMQPKTAASTQKPQPPAPPVYRPQPVAGALQAKNAAAHQPVNQTKRAPVAPPVYHPQPTPKVLQTKTAQTRQQQPKTGSPHKPVAPPAYRPQSLPKVLQPKKVQAATGGGARVKSQPPSQHRAHAQRTVQRKLGGNVIQRARGDAADILRLKAARTARRQAAQQAPSDPFSLADPLSEIASSLYTGNTQGTLAVALTTEKHLV
ncbi:MAG TPA: hypothetical protein VD835_02850, partial [Pyrinomonadaceae bacterium]|nr:hypothetical protein [Pyrinomonadaceae bacterium]